MDVSLFLEWALSTSLALSGLIFIILLIRGWVARNFGARAAYALWILPVIRFLMPAITLPHELNFLGISPELPSAEHGYGTAIPLSDDMFGVVSNPVNDLHPGGFVTGAELIFIIWVTGGVIFLGLQFLRQMHYQNHLTRQSRPADKSTYELLHRAVKMAGLKRSPELRQSTGHMGPLVSGLARPVIILPCDFHGRFDDEQRYLTLCHEVMHIRRGDLWTNGFALFMRGLNWPNPLIHLAYRYFRADQEAACDAALLHRAPMASPSSCLRKTYAETLLQAAKPQSENDPTMSFYKAVPVGLTLNHPLKERLMRLNINVPKQSLRSKAALATALIGMMAMLSPVTYAAPQSSESASELAGGDDAKKPKTIRKTVSIVSQHNGEDDDFGVGKIEIDEKDGVRTIYKIDPDTGDKTVIREYQIGQESLVIRNIIGALGDGLNGRIALIDSVDGDVRSFELSQGAGIFIAASDIDGEEVRELFKSEDGEKITGKVIFRTYKPSILSGDNKGTFFIHAAEAQIGHAMELLENQVDREAFEGLNEKGLRKMTKQISDARKELQQARKELQQALKDLDDAQASLEQDEE